jgi:hypothetical protein
MACRQGHAAGRKEVKKVRVGGQGPAGLYGDLQGDTARAHAAQHAAVSAANKQHPAVRSSTAANKQQQYSTVHHALTATPLSCALKACLADISRSAPLTAEREGSHTAAMGGGQEPGSPASMGQQD